jgi:hypothetical protein
VIGLGVGVALLASAGPGRALASPFMTAALGKVTVDLSRPVSSFQPSEAFGAAIDGEKQGQVTRIYTPANIAKMRTAGLKRISYSLRTELANEAWHWSEQGSWSDPKAQQGYWTSSDRLDQNVLISHGYRLPRRGNTFDQAQNDGYSRLTDGDEQTFWKSNPYLEQHYTGESNERYPQWIVIDFGAPKPINAVKIDWGLPYATRYEVQFWNGADDSFNEVNGEWHRFVDGLVEGADGASTSHRLVGTPVQVRYIRIVLLDSSGTGPPGSTDLRDSLGFAIRELSLGLIDDKGVFRDEIRHAPSNAVQTAVYTSSTDPWHRATDIDPNTEQPGFDLVFASGLSSGLPMLIPVPILYDTPENVAAEIRFLKARGYPLRQIVLGEEPDGQVVSTEHEAQLFLQFASAIHAVDPTLVLGGPSFQGGIVYQGYDVKPNTSWIERFLGYLRYHGRLRDYQFLSFEWYPFDDLCRDTSAQLRQQPELLRRVIDTMHAEGVPSSFPVLVTEYGFAAYAARPLVELPAALMNADIVGEFLTLGGRAVYLYGYEPMTLLAQQGECGGYGQLTLFEANERGEARWPMPTYFATRLLTHEWAQPGDRPHALYSASSDVIDHEGRAIVTAYALMRPDGKLSVLLVNKDPRRAYAMHVRIAGSKNADHFLGAVQAVQYSTQQYEWKEAGPNGHPINNDPPRRFVLHDGEGVWLPPYSLTVLRGSTTAPLSQMASIREPRHSPQ